MRHDEDNLFKCVIFGSLLFAQDILREAVDNADYDAVRQMIKKMK